MTVMSILQENNKAKSTVNLYKIPLANWTRHNFDLVCTDFNRGEAIYHRVQCNISSWCYYLIEQGGNVINYETTGIYNGNATQQIIEKDGQNTKKSIY